MMNRIIMVTFALLIIGCSKHGNLPNGSNEMKFDPEVWKSESPLSNTPGELATKRQKMLEDLVVNILPGKTEKEITSLLGESLETFYGGTSRDLIYYTGPERDSYFPIDSEWLLIWLDEHKKYKTYALHND